MYFHNTYTTLLRQHCQMGLTIDSISWIVQIDRGINESNCLISDVGHSLKVVSFDPMKISFKLPNLSYSIIGLDNFY